MVLFAPFFALSSKLLSFLFALVPLIAHGFNRMMRAFLTDLSILNSLMFTLAISRACSSYASDPCSDVVSDAVSSAVSSAEISTSLLARYSLIQRMTREQKVTRVRELYGVLQEIVNLAHGRPLETSRTDSLQVTTLSGGLMDIFVSDLFSSEAIQEVIRRLRATGLSANMWIAVKGEEMPTENNYGLTKTIVEYEHLLAELLRLLESDDLEDGLKVAYVFDMIIRKHQVYLNLSKELRDALDRNYTLVGFDHEGLICPPNYPSQSLVGSHVIVEVKVIRDSSGASSKMRLKEELDRWEKVLPMLQRGEVIPIELYPLATANPPSIENAHYRMGVLKRILPNMHDEDGIIAGTITAINGVAFTVDTGDGRSLTLNANSLSFRGGIAVLPQQSL